MTNSLINSPRSPPPGSPRGSRPPAPALEAPNPACTTVRRPTDEPPSQPECVRDSPTFALPTHDLGDVNRFKFPRFGFSSAKTEHRGELGADDPLEK